MTKQTFILVSLGEKKSKELAQLLSNDTCRKILDYLGGVDEATESQISNELNIPLSTVHYNMQHLLLHKLVESKEFMWSEKGRQMDIYRVAKKLIVIAPQTTKDLKNQLKSLVPVGLVSLAAAALIKFVYQFTSSGAAKSMASEGLLRATPSFEAAQSSSAVASQPSIALWFLFGALFALLVYATVLLIKRKPKNFF